jgi:heme/copper-type cytochrome/quinol oxidase subunit 4
MDATFFALAFSTVLNPKLYALDLVLIANKRPRLMFIAFLVGGIGLNVTLGLLDVLVFQADAVSSQSSVSAGIELAIGVVLLAVGALMASGRPRHEQRPEDSTAREGWTERNLREPRPWLALGIGALAGTPGAAYITALHNLISDDYSTATQVAGVFVFNLIQWSPVLVPFIFLEARPDATKRVLQGVIDWLTSHARRIGAALAFAVGAYATISGLARLLS